MGLIKKKKEDKKQEVEGGLLMQVPVVMHNTTTLTATEEGDGCHVLLQSDVLMSPQQWQQLAQYAREGKEFSLCVLEGKQHES